MRKATALACLVVWSSACSKDRAKPPERPPVLSNKAHVCTEHRDCPIYERCYPEIQLCTRTCYEDRDCNFDYQKCVIDKDGFATCITPRQEQDDSEPSVASEPGATDTSGDCISEIDCLVADNPPPCCQRYADERARRLRMASPKTISRMDLIRAMRPARPGMRTCGRTHGLRDVTINVTLTVEHDGSVTRVQVDPSSNRAFVECAEQVLAKLKLPTTSNGTTVTYPYRF